MINEDKGGSGEYKKTGFTLRESYDLMLKTGPNRC